MERLTIKELAPYLPYGVNVIFNNEIKGVLCGITTGLMDLEVIEDYDNNTPLIKKWCSSDTKLLLKPISELVNSTLLEKWLIEHNIEVRYNKKLLLDIQSAYTIDILGYPVEFLRELLEHHFDVFGLIDRNLALPIDGKEVEGCQ